MYKEIGSEFWNVPTRDEKNNLFPGNTQWFLSGRNALMAIVGELEGCKTVAVPSWCCDSIIKPFADAGIRIVFYPVYWRKKLFCEISRDCDVLFLMDFFGYSSFDSGINDYRGIVIRDVTHSLFSAVYTDADYYFGSLRKWCGVWTGGYAWTKDGHQIQAECSEEKRYVNLRQKAMQLKKSYINEENKDKGYLTLFSEAEELLESNKGVSFAAERDIRLAYHLDYEMIKTMRRQNAGIIQSAFHDWLMFPSMSLTDCPMFVPVLVPDGKRDALRQHLTRNSIYCPVHWPVSDYHKLTDEERYIYDNGLSIVCDQRYSSEDMEHIVKTIEEFMED